MRLQFRFVEITLSTRERSSLKRIYAFFERLGIPARQLVRAGFPGKYRVSFYAKTSSEAQRIREHYLLRPIPQVRWRLKRLGKHDWFDKWEKDYPILPVGSRFTVVPFWRKKIYLKQKDKRLPLYLDPAGAFGSGMHETTQLVIRLMEKLSPQNSFLDIGTGTGILMAAAFRLGLKELAGFDSDKISVHAAKKNLEYNGCRNYRVVSKNLSQLNTNARYDWVAANLIQSLLLEFRSKIAGTVQPGGYLMVSGVLKKYLDEFTQQFRLPGFKCLRTLKGRSWGAVLYRRI